MNDKRLDEATGERQRFLPPRVQRETDPPVSSNDQSRLLMMAGLWTSTGLRADMSASICQSCRAVSDALTLGDVIGSYVHPGGWKMGAALAYERLSMALTFAWGSSASLRLPPRPPPPSTVGIPGHPAHRRTAYDRRRRRQVGHCSAGGPAGSGVRKALVPSSTRCPAASTAARP